MTKTQGLEVKFGKKNIDTYCIIYIFMPIFSIGIIGTF